jgi:hypothetical protein
MLLNLRMSSQTRATGYTTTLVRRVDTDSVRTSALFAQLFCWACRIAGVRTRFAWSKRLCEQVQREQFTLSMVIDVR